MLTFFRNFFKSKIGLGLTLGFLALIAFAFASSDVANTGTFGGVAGGERVAVVGDVKIGTAEFSQTASTALDRVRQQDPTISMQAFVEQGGLEEVLDQLIDRYAIDSFGRELGLRAGDNLVNSEIQQIGAFRGPDGNFSQDAYNQALAQQGLSDSMVRDDIRTGLIARQLLTPATFGAAMPASIARRYAQLFKERRTGGIAVLPAALYAPTGDPSDAVLAEFYRDNRSRFIRPERRVIRYASFDSAAVADSIEPTDAEIRQRYQQDAAEYAASETRSFSQLIVPTEAAARSIRQRVNAGASLDSVAREAGFSVVDVEDATRASIRGDSSEAVAAAYFATPRGTVSQPAQSPLGWHIAQVTDVETSAARSLAQARADIAETIREEKRLRALADLAAQIEEEIDGGATLAEVARQFGLELQTTRPLTADGRFYGGSNEPVPPALAPTIATAFQMEESEPQVGEVERGETYVAFEVSDITPSAAAPLAEIREDVVAAWKLAQGSQAAREAAARVIGRLRDDGTLAAALRAEEKNLPPVQNVSMTREDLASQGERRVPPPLALMFSMAQGTAKRLEIAGNQGWYVVDLNSIELGEIAADDPLVVQARQQLGAQVADEYQRQMVAAMREEVGVERNPDAIEAVRSQLTGNLPAGL
ncbi:SurA N-terminal domain-containing protein [Qipengyuania sp. MTN3-11]|uniref:SurA N-terminal domain-containing protein n=1 Tax=Qipengyuania sp. MTN3-11 TaxID=3056557 RepID=UPI0036F37A80